MKLINTVGSIVAFSIAAFLIYNLYSSVKEPIDERSKISSIESAIITKLEVIRDLEVIYQIQNGKYANEEELIKFAKDGQLFIINKTETQVDENTVETSIDTLGTVPVLDSMKNKYKFDENIIKAGDFDKYETILNDINNLLVIPGTDGKYKFALETGEVTKNNIKIDVFVARDIFPINPDRGGAFEVSERKHIDSVTAKINRDIDQLDKNIRYYQQEVDKKKLEIIPNYADYLAKKDLYAELSLIIQNGYVYPDFDVDSLNFPENKMVPMVPGPNDDMVPAKSPEKDLEPIRAKAEELQEELVAKQKEYSEKYNDSFNEENEKIAGYERQMEELETKLEFYETKPLQVGSLTEVTTNGNWQ